MDVNDWNSNEHVLACKNSNEHDKKVKSEGLRLVPRAAKHLSTDGGKS